MSIRLKGVNAGYDTPVLHDVSLEVERGAFTALIGPNGCGKSTLMKTVARILKPTSGSIHVEGRDFTRIGGREAARTIAYLPQNPLVPPAVTVEELVGYGRAPHQSLLGLKRAEDREATQHAIAATDLEAMRDRRVSELSGGQRQRAFIAMVLAQETPVIMLDEPTTFLDIKYQFETLDLVEELNEMGRTVIVVLHDIGQAARYAEQMVVMKDGRVFTGGRPEEVITPEVIRKVYDFDCEVYEDPVTGTPAVALQKRAARGRTRAVA